MALIHAAIHAVKQAGFVRENRMGGPAPARVQNDLDATVVMVELANNVGRVMTTRLLLQRVWGAQYIDATGYVKGIVRRLRVKLEPDPAHPTYIITEPYLGYRLVDNMSG